LAYCSTSKKVQSTSANSAKITYAANVQPVIAATCSPCHIPPEGKKKPYDNYNAVKNDIDEILVRVQKNPGEKGFMPARHPKLPDSTIQMLAQWKKDGLPE
jgi:nitrate/TMAO reductase-like tetraheme cytochrome c subunit